MDERKMAKAPADDLLIAAVLTSAQQDTVRHYRALSVGASWFVGVADKAGRVEVLALGDNFVWSFRIDADGETHAAEAEVLPFKTGIDC